MGRMRTFQRPPPSGAVIFYGGKPTRKDSRNLSEDPHLKEDSSDEDVSEEVSIASGRTSTSTGVTDVSQLSLSDSDYRTSLSSESHPSSANGRALHDFAAIITLSKEIIGIFSYAPYVQAVAKTLLQIIQIAEEVQTNRDRANELVQKIVLYAGVIFEALKSPPVRSGPTLNDLRADLIQLGKVLESSLATLRSLFDKSNTSRFNQVLRRGEHLGQIQELDRKLDTVITSFQVRSSIALRTNQPPPPGTAQADSAKKDANRPPPLTRLRSKPRIMYGRTQEISQHVDMILNHSPARIAILGPGGIGKTSLALAVLHDEKIVARFGSNRLFLSCEAATSSNHILGDLAWILNLSIEGIQDRLLDVICEWLQASQFILVLDNFETPWETPEGRSEVEALLHELGSIETLTLIVTMRGSQHPVDVAWSQLSPPLQSLDMDSAMQIFKTICKQDDEYASKLVVAVDCVPLAVTLLANLAAVDGETTQALWKRWSSESTSMVESGSGRLSSVDFSIQLSVSSPRMKRHPDALRLLSVISLLPHGVSKELALWLENGVPGISNPMKAMATLRQNSLIFPCSSGTIRLLSPIRLHVLARHPPPPEAKRALQDHYMALAYQAGSNDATSVRDRLCRESGNTETMLINALNDTPSPQRLEEVAQAILSYCHYTYMHGLCSARALSLAIQKLEQHPSPSDIRSPVRPLPQTCDQSKVRHVWRRRLGGLRFWKAQNTPGEAQPAENTLKTAVIQYLKLRADCLGCLGQLQAREINLEEAEDSFNAAKALHMQAGDLAGQAYDVHNLACLLSRNWLDYTSNSEDSDRCIEMFEEASKLHEKAGDKGGMAYDLLGLGNHLLQTPDHARAEDTMLEAVQLFRAANDRSGEASCLTGLGQANLTCSEFAKSKDYFEQALAIDCDDPVGKAENLAGIASTFLLRSHFDEARRYIDEAIAMRSPIENPDHLHLLGRVYLAQYRFKDAESTLQRSLELHTQINDTVGMADDRLYLTYLHFYQGHLRMGRSQFFDTQDTVDDEDDEDDEDEWRAHPFGNMSAAYKEFTVGYANAYATTGVMRLVWQCSIPKDIPDAPGWEDHAALDQAFEDLNEGLTCFKDLKCRLGQGFALHYLGCAHLRCGQIPDAETKLRGALSLHEEVGNIQGQADDHNKLAEVAMRQDSLQEALTRVTCYALKLHTQCGDIGGQGDDIYLQACIYLKQGRLNEAEVAIRQALDLHTQAGLAYHKGLTLATLSSVVWQKYLSGDQAEEELRREAYGCLEEAIGIFRCYHSRLEYVQCSRQLTEMRNVVSQGSVDEVM